MTGSKFRSELKVKNINIYNLWGRDEISIPINEKVTFLTGINGSGKSSLLNIFFDSLVLDPKKMKMPGTSKNRFWSSRCTFTNDFIIETLILPYLDNNIDLDKLDERLKDNLSDIKILKEVQNVFFEAESDEEITYISYDSEPKGEVWRKQHTFPSKKAGEEFSIREQSPLAFIYQDDRVTLHARNEDSEKEKNSFYRSIYRSSIDERFEYLRDAIQVQESLYYKQLAGVFSKINEKIKFDDVIQSPEYASVTEKLEEIDNIVLTLNSYFEMSGKQVVKDEYNKYTLALINEDPDNEEYKPISWNLLSRGEKTLLYLFFAVYYYKDKVNVFLLDEPDISLHVSWQENLISDLLSIAPNNQFIVATHSPSLVMNGWMDNCLDLKV